MTCKIKIAFQWREIIEKIQDEFSIPWSVHMINSFGNIAILISCLCLTLSAICLIKIWILIKMLPEAIFSVFMRNIIFTKKNSSCVQNLTQMAVQASQNCGLQLISWFHAMWFSWILVQPCFLFRLFRRNLIICNKSQMYHEL